MCSINIGLIKSKSIYFSNSIHWSQAAERERPGNNSLKITI
jgi:hypothetical protein